jgi:hypothetical protein
VKFAKELFENKFLKKKKSKTGQMNAARLNKPATDVSKEKGIKIVAI